MTGDLAALAAWIDTALDDENTSRQAIAERALAVLRDLAAAPGAVLGDSDLQVVLGGLDHAEQLMRERAGAWCQCGDDHEDGPCGLQRQDLDQAAAYAALAARLGGWA